MRCVSEAETQKIEGRVPEQLLDQVDVGHEHTAAAVACQAELIHGVTVMSC
jgi:hypothetical protein